MPTRKKTAATIGRERAARDELLRDAGVGVWQFDPDSDLYTFAPELTAHFGEGPHTVPRAALESICHRDDLEIERPLRERITREGGTGEMELRMRAPGGAGWRHLRVLLRSGRRLPSGRFEMYGLTLNVTDTAAARNQARAKADQLNLALRAARGGVYEIDFRARTFQCSQEFVALVGREITYDDTPGGVWSVVHPDDADAMRKMGGHWGTAGHVSVDVRTMARPGEPWIRIYCDIVRDGIGRPIRGVGLVLDIDALKRQELALVAAEQEASSANHAKSAFLATMSHELRTPLNAIIGFSQMIAEQMVGPVGPKYIRYAEDIRTSGMHLLDLINEVLDLSKLDAGKLELNESDVDIRQLSKDCLALIKPIAEAARLTVVEDIRSDLPLLRADARALKQVLLNFLSNAIKFTPAGGTVTIRITQLRHEIQLSVQDTGIGMSEADIAVAMEPFGQVRHNPHVSREQIGTGLGLPISLKLMKLHGGDVTIESAPNRGTTITAHLPASRFVSAAA